MLVIIEYVGCTFKKLPSDSSNSTILQLLLPSLAELFDDLRVGVRYYTIYNIIENIPECV